MLDIDLAAHKVAVKSNRGAILLLDFKAAFPSISLDYLWDAALKTFYHNNKHHIKIRGSLYDSFTCKSGVRQGCPLSGILFALSIDLLLREVDKVLVGDAVVRGYADDTAIVVDNYLRDMQPWLAPVA